MEFGVEVSQQQLSWAELRSRVLLVEELGFDIVWLSDHFKPTFGREDGPCLDGWTLLAGLAIVTSQIRLGILVSGAAFRHPAALVAQAVTADHLSDGRLELGLGAGWFQAEHIGFGFGFPPLQERAERLEDAAVVVKALLSGAAVSHEGPYYRLTGATYRPLPVQGRRLRLWMGGGEEKVVLPAIARQADVWHCFGEPEELAKKSRLVDAYAAMAGRQPADIARSASVSLDDQPWQELRSKLEQLSGLGVSSVVIDWPQDGACRLREFWREMRITEHPRGS